MPTLRERLQADPFQGYAYAYPHKTAYRHFPEPLPLRELWRDEPRDALFLYVHLPFCEMRCGFCNLFTTTNPKGGRVERYLDALERQAGAVGAALGEHAWARGALGGGTPTFLTVEEMARCFRILRAIGLREGVPLSCELSPGTAEAEKIAQLREEGVTRASIGVQSFIEAETRALGRPQRPAVLHDALRRLADAGFPVFNVDLIYGVDGQTPASWRHSLEAAVAYDPEEIFLYPLYVRPLTGLGRHGCDPSDRRLELFRIGRDFLRERGYRQISLRLFRREGVACEAGGEGASYCCQEDGMVGLGAGARSYTREVHYCTEYAVGRTGIEAILEHYLGMSADESAHAWYGCRLTQEEQRRRYVIKSLLRVDGLDGADYRAWFGTNPGEDFPELDELVFTGLGERTGGRLVLTEAGLERADTIGPWLYSGGVEERMESYQLA